MAQPRDPFYAVKDKVTAALQELRGGIDRAEEVLKSGGESSEVEPVLSACRADMSQIHIDVKDLSQTITIVEENRTRFVSIDNRELDSRRAFVTDAKTTLSQYDDLIKRLSSRASAASNKRKQLLSNNSSDDSKFNAAANAEIGRANDDYVNSSRQSAQLMEARQDEVLDDMTHVLGRLEGIGQTINQQLVEGDHHLQALDNEMDTAKNTMDTVLKKMDKLLKTSDRSRLCCIVILFVLAIALFFGIVYG